MEKTIVGCQFFGSFPSERILKAKKDVDVHFLFTVSLMPQLL